LLEEEDNVNDADLEKVDSSLEKEDKVDDDEKIDRCNYVRKFLRTISLG
jgi:hypothetical protein